MATIEQMRGVMHAVPFQPFRVRLVDGRSFAVRHPDFIAISPGRGRECTIHDDDGPHFLDLGLVVEIHPETAPAAIPPPSD
jgi:hypothetical protein